MFGASIRRYLGITVARVTSRPIWTTPIGLPTPVDSDNISFRVIEKRDLLPYCADPELELCDPFVRAAFDRGDWCVAAFDGNALIGYHWLAFGPAPHIDGVWVACDARARYGYKQFVRPQYRGRRIAGRLSTHCDALCAQRGCNRAIAFINIENHASWRAQLHRGAHTVGYAGYFKWQGLFAGFRTPGARKLKFRFFVPRRTQPIATPSQKAAR